MKKSYNNILLCIYFYFQCANCIVSLLIMVPILILLAGFALSGENFSAGVCLTFLIYMIFLSGSLVATRKLVRHKNLNSFEVSSLILFPVFFLISGMYLYSIYDQLQRYGL